MGKCKKFIAVEEKIRHDVGGELPRNIIHTFAVFGFLLFPFPLVFILLGPAEIGRFVMMFVACWWAFFVLVATWSDIRTYGVIPSRRKAAMEAEIQRRLKDERQRGLDSWREEDERSNRLSGEAPEGAEVITLEDYEPSGLRLGDDGELLDPPAEERRRRSGAYS